jgi:hypothetical protein
MSFPCLPPLDLNYKCLIYLSQFLIVKLVILNAKRVSFSKLDFSFLLKALTKQTSMSYSAIIL